MNQQVNHLLGLIHLHGIHQPPPGVNCCVTAEAAPVVAIPASTSLATKSLSPEKISLAPNA